MKKYRFIRFMRKLFSKEVVIPWAESPMDELAQDMVQFSGRP